MLERAGFESYFRLCGGDWLMGQIIVVTWIGCAAVICIYWFFLWRTMRRWNSLLRRNGQAVDEALMYKTFKMLRFVWGRQYRALDDKKLDRLVVTTRVWMALSGVAALLVWPYVLHVVTRAQ